MGNASLMDVFNAGARTASQGLDMVSRGMQYERDAALNESAHRGEQEAAKWKAQFVKGFDENGRELPQTPEAYEKFMLDRIAKWRDEQSKKYPGSQYFQDGLRKVELGLTDYAVKEYARADFERTVVRNKSALDKGLNNILNESPEFTGMRVAADENAAREQEGAAFVPWDENRKRLAGERSKLKRALDEINRAAASTLGQFPEYLEQKRQAVYLDIFTDAASMPENYQGTTEDAGKYLDSLAGDRIFMTNVPDLAERVAAFKPVWTKAVQDRNENKIELANAGYVQLMQDYRNTGNPDYMIQAINLRAAWLPVKRGALERGNNEYSPEGKIKIAGMFDEFPRQDKKEQDYELEKQLADEFVDRMMNTFDPALGNAPPLNPVGKDKEDRPIDKYGFATRGVPFNDIVYNMSVILESAGVQSSEAQFKRTLYDVFRERVMKTLPVDSEAEGYVETLFGPGNPFRLTDDTEDIEDIVGRDIKDPGFKEELQKINNDIDTACFNALAGIRPGPEARKQLETALTAIGRRYVGETFQLMRDSLNEQRTEQTASLTAGDTEGLAAKIKAMEKTGSRDNRGDWIFPQTDRETVAAVKQEARKTLEGLTGDGWDIDDSGNTVIARKPGHEVMITGNDRNELVLRERKTGSHRGRTSATGWTDIAVFTYVPDFGDAWVDVRLHTLEQQDEAWSDSDWRAFKQRNEAWENSRLHRLEEPDIFKYSLFNGIDKPAGEIQKKERPGEQPARGRRR